MANRFGDVEAPQSRVNRFGDAPAGVVIAGMEKLGPLPGAPKDPNANPIEKDLTSKNRHPGESIFDYLDRQANLSPSGMAAANEIEADRAAGRQIVQGVKDVATAPTGERKAKGASQAIRGAMHYGRGLVPALGPMAPVATAVGLGVGMGAQAGTEKALELAGVDEGYRELAGDVAGLAAGGGAAKATGKAGAVIDLARKNPELARAAAELVIPKRVLTFRDKLNAALEKMAPPTPGQELAKANGLDWGSLKPEEQAILENAAKAQANTAAQARPVGPRQPVETQPTAPVEPPATTPGGDKTLAELLREELEARRGPEPPDEGPQPLQGGHEPKPIRLRAAAPLRPPLRQSAAPAEAPPPPSEEVIQQQPSAVPAAVEPQAAAAPTPAPQPAQPVTLNPVEIGRRIMRSMGMEDVTPKQALDTFRNLQEYSARSGMPLEAAYQKYTGEPLAGVQEPGPPKPITPKQGEAAMFRTKDLQAEVSPFVKPEDARSFYTESGETVSKQLRAEQKKVYNADAKAKRFAEAFAAQGITAEDVGNLTAEDAKVMTDALIAKGLLKKGEMPPRTSLPRIIGHLKQMERAKAATAGK